VKAGSIGKSHLVQHLRENVVASDAGKDKGE
jgi:hypothetical protein